MIFPSPSFLVIFRDIFSWFFFRNILFWWFFLHILFWWFFRDIFWWFIFPRHSRHVSNNSPVWTFFVRIFCSFFLFIKYAIKGTPETPLEIKTAWYLEVQGSLNWSPIMPTVVCLLDSWWFFSSLTYWEGNVTFSVKEVHHCFYHYYVMRTIQINLVFTIFPLI